MLRSVFAVMVSALSFGACRVDDAPASETRADADEAEAVSQSTTPVVTPSPSSAPSAPLPRPHVSDVEYSIVWGNVNGHAPESFLLEWRPPELKVLAKRSGATFFSEGGVYRWKETVAKAELMIDCDEAWNPPEKPNPKNRTPIEVFGAKLVRLDAPGEIELVAPPVVDESASSFDNRVTLHASVDSTLFYTEHEDSNYCRAAHNSWGHSPRIYDFAKRRSLDLTKADEKLLGIEARSLPKEAQEECAEAVRRAGLEGPESVEGLGLESIWPTWSKERGLGFLLGFAGMNTYWQGLHRCQVEVRSAPPSFEGFKAPEAFKALPKKLPQLHVQGWSSLPPGDEVGLAAANLAFRRKAKK